MGKDGKLRRKKKTDTEKLVGRQHKNSLDISYFQAGLKVWIENPYDESTQDGYRRGEYGKQQCTRPKYVPAVCVESDAALGKVSVRTDFTPNLELMLLPALVWPRNNKTNLDDMINFPHLHEPALLNVSFRGLEFSLRLFLALYCTPEPDLFLFGRMYSQVLTSS